MRKYLILFALLLMVCFFYLWENEAINVFKIIFSGDVQKAVDLIRRAGSTAVLFSILINVTISLMGVIPSVFLTGANIIIFGLSIGFLISWAGEVAGAAISFLLYRWGLTSVAKLSTKQWKLFKTINSLPPMNQTYFLFILRMAPFIPSGLINLFGSLTSISLFNFLIATTAGKFPALLLETAFSYHLITLGRNYIYLGISILIALLLYLSIKKEMKRLEKQYEQ